MGGKEIGIERKREGKKKGEKERGIERKRDRKKEG